MNEHPAPTQYAAEKPQFIPLCSASLQLQLPAAGGDGAVFVKSALPIASRRPRRVPERERGKALNILH